MPLGTLFSLFLHYSRSSRKLSLAIPKDLTPQTPLDWIQEKASWYSYTQSVLIKCTKIEIFHNSLYLMVFLNEYILLSFPFTIGVSCLSGWSIVLKHITWMVKYCLYYFRSGCKQLLGKVRKFGRSVHTLIHTP